MSRHRKCLLIAVVAVGGSVPGCNLMRKYHGKPQVERKTTSSGATAKVAAPLLDQPNRIVAPGIVEPWGGEIGLSPRESGWIADVLVTEGQHVEAGQLLVILDDETQRVAVELAEADLGEADAGLSKTVHGSTAEELRQVRADAENCL